MAVGEILREGGNTYDERHKVYGDNYLNYGKVMKGLFPDGINMSDEKDWVQLGLVHNCVTKLGRYCANIGKGGHKDSAHDLMVYAAMLEEVTNG